MLELWQEKLENVNVQEPHLTPNRVLNAETNEKPFLDCIFDSNNLSAHIIMLTSHSNVSSQGKAGSLQPVLFCWSQEEEGGGRREGRKMLLSFNE